MSKQTQKVYIVRPIESDPREEVAECARCHTSYSRDQVGRYCSKDGNKIGLGKKLPKNLATLLDGFEFSEDGEIIGVKIIDEEKSYGFWGCKTKGNNNALLPNESQLGEYESLISSAGIKFKEGYGWNIISQSKVY